MLKSRSCNTNLLSYLTKAPACVTFQGQLPKVIGLVGSLPT